MLTSHMHIMSMPAPHVTSTTWRIRHDRTEQARKHNTHNQSSQSATASSGPPTIRVHRNFLFKKSSCSRDTRRRNPAHMMVSTTLQSPFIVTHYRARYHRPLKRAGAHALRSHVSYTYTTHSLSNPNDTLTCSPSSPQSAAHLIQP
jgi:hypothetical protein